MAHLVVVAESAASSKVRCNASRFEAASCASGGRTPRVSRVAVRLDKRGDGLLLQWLHLQRRTTLAGVAGVVAAHHALLPHLSASASCFLQKRELGDAASVPHALPSRRGAGHEQPSSRPKYRARGRARYFIPRRVLRVGGAASERSPRFAGGVRGAGGALRTARGAVELAFVAALQHLVGAAARDADLARSVWLPCAGSVRGARHVGRVGEQRAAARSQLARAAGSRAKSAADASPARRRASQEIVDAYIDAWNRRRDVDELRSLPGRGRRLLDAAAGDPVAGPDAIVAVAEAGVDACPESRAVLTHANGQPAIAYYNVDSETDTCPPRSTSSRSTGSPSPRSPAS